MSSNDTEDLGGLPRVLGAARDAVLAMDEHGRLVYMNEAAERTFGYAPEDAVGRTVAELVIPPRLRAAHRAGLARARRGDPSRILERHVELSALRADGEEFPVELTVTRTSEDPIRFTAWVRDLTASRSAAEESSRRKALLEHAERLAQVGSWAWTPETGDLLWSANLYALFGYEADEVRPSVELVLERTHPDDRARVGDAIEAGGRSGELDPFDMRIVQADGAVRHLKVTAGATGRRAAAPLELVGSVQDVTDRWRVERKIAAHLAVSEALASWETLETGGERLLRDLARALGATVGMLWLPEDGTLCRRLMWSEPSADVGELERVTRDLRLRSGLGLPGRAWEREVPVALTRAVPRGLAGRDAAGRLGLAGGLALPAIASTGVVAVIELYSREDADLTARLLRSLLGVGYELGAFLARRRGQLCDHPLTPRELEILQLAAHGLSGPEIATRLFLSPATVKSHLEHVRAKLRVPDRASSVAYALRAGLID
jgi:PAS domain S-box-containing protein